MGMWLGYMLADARFALRSFRRGPGYVAATLTVLGLGIGGVTLVFSTLNSVVMRPLPFPEAERLVWFWGEREGATRNSISAENYRDYRARVHAFESVGAFLVFRPSAVVTGGDEPERVVTNVVSASLFPTLGVAPDHGRGFQPQDESPSSSDPLVVSHALAQRRFGSPASAVGATLTVDGIAREIVGVMPAGFDYPGDVDVWRPLRMDEGYAQGRGNNNFWAIGRLAAGATLRRAQSQADVVARSLQEAYPDTNEAWAMRLEGLHETTVAGARPALLMLTALVSLLLLVACANAASISVARATSRGTELAVRLALGGSRRRVVSQLLSEHLLLALGGGVVGVVLAWAGARAVRALGPATLPRVDTVALDGATLAVAFSVALLTGVIFGVLPAIAGTRLSLAGTLRSGTAGAGGARGSRGRSTLAVTQIAVSLMLLIASGLLVRSYARLQQVDTGILTEGLHVAELQMLDERQADDGAVHQAWDAVYDRIRALPGVVTVAATDQVPIRLGGTYNSVFAEGHEPASPADYQPAQRRFVTEGYFTTLGSPFRAGRDFSTTDDRQTPTVAVINESLARRLWPNRDAVGRKLVWGDRPVEVIGVVADIRDFGPASEAQPTFFVSIRQLPRALSTAQVLVRTRGRAPQLAAELRTAVWDVDPAIPVSGVQSMEERIRGSLARPRFRARLVGTFGAIALVLACFGIYGVLAHHVRQRARELAVRQALGASRRAVVGHVMTRGMTLVGLGIAFGLTGGAAGARLMGAFLFGLAATDVATYAGVTLILLAAAASACLVPAVWAVRVDPANALRAE